MAKTKTFTLSNGTINSYKIRIKTDAILLEDFIANPIMLKDHVRGSLNIIGKWLNIRVEGEQLLAEPEFDLGCADGKEIARRVATGFLKGISIMGEILEAHIELIDGLEIIIVTKFHLKEVSFVDIPSNKTCLVLCDKEMNILTDWTFSDLPVEELIITKTQNVMDFKKIAVELGLADTATESEILAALKAQGVIVGNFADSQKQQKANQVTEITSLIDACLADGRITDATMKPTYLKLADLDFDTTKKTLESLPKPQSLTQILRGGGVAQAQTGGSVAATFADMSKNNPKGLAKLHKDNPAEFARLYEAEHGISLADDISMTQSVPE